MSMPASASAEIPSNIYKPNAPLEAGVIEHFRLTAPESPNEVTHIVLDIAGSDLKYLEGQSIGILPPGEDANGRPHKLRLYSIASPSYGDDGQGNTVSVCVKRAVTITEDGTRYEGVCSSYLCDLKVGDTVRLTGPVGKSFLQPADEDANLIMMATGTGIAPFRAFLHNRYEKRPDERGENWLFFGAQTRKDFLYEAELAQFGQHDTFKLITAFSREEQTADGARMYVQHRLVEHADRLIDLLQNPKTYFFICGLRGMETGILTGLEQAAQVKGIDWNTLYERLKAEKRWHIEVY